MRVLKYFDHDLKNIKKTTTKETGNNLKDHGTYKLLLNNHFKPNISMHILGVDVNCLDSKNGRNEMLWT